MDSLRYAYELVAVGVEVCLQKLKMWSLPGVDLIGGPAQGLVVIVTGPTSGIGREVASALARRGAVVVLACRSTQRGEALKAELEAAAEAAGQAKPQLQVARLDLSSLASVREFAAAWGRRPLHALVNNAGVFALAGPRAATEDGFEMHLGTNHLGHFLLTLLLLPSLCDTAQQSGRAARVVNVSSKLHYLGRVHREDPHLAAASHYTNTAAYCQSKLAQVLFAAELQRRTGGAVAAVAVHPGEVLTDVVRSLPPLMQRAYRLALGLVLLTPSQGARSAVYCATSPDLDPPKFRGQSYFDSNCAAIPPSAAAADPELAAWLWGWSAAQVELPPTRDLPPAAATGQ